MTEQTQCLQGYFITGSDTGVGKTWIARQVVNQLNQCGHMVKVRKPVESGCEAIDGEYFPADGHSLYQANQQREQLSLVTPYRFRAALAPDRAARLEHTRLTIDMLYQSVIEQVNVTDTLLVEGAGGFYSPIADDGLNADLARKLGLKVIIVTTDRLGAINQALLTIAAVKQEGLAIQALILNQNIHTNEDSGLHNIEDLKLRTDVPLFNCAYGAELPTKVV